MSHNSTDGWESLPVYLTYVIQGLLIGGSNFLIVICILRHEALRRTKEYLIIMGLSLADGLNMAAYFSAGVYRIVLLVTGHHNEQRTSWQCITTVHNLLWSFAEALAGLVLLVVSVDRLLSVATPLKYLKWTRKYALHFLGSVYLYSILTGTVPSLLLVYNKDQTTLVAARCLASQSLANTNELYILYIVSASPLFAFVSVILYVSVWFLYKKKRVHVDQHDQQQLKLRRQRKLTKSLGISCLCTFWLYVVPFSCGYIFMWNGWENISLIFFIISNLNPLCNVIIYPKRHSEIRQGLKAVFTRKQMPPSVNMWKHSY